VCAYVALAAVTFIAFPARSQTAPAPAWSFTKYFQYNIEQVLVHAAGVRTWDVKVVFSVTNPNPDASFPNKTWDIQADLPFRSAGASMSMLIGWDSAEFSDAGSTGAASTPVVTTALGTGAALPVQIRNLTQPGPTPPQVAKRCTAVDCPGLADLTNRFWVSRVVTPVAFVQDIKTGRIGIEGKPVCNGPGCPTTAAPFANIPVRSATADFSFLDVATPTSAMIASPRRVVVDFATKCRGCHNGTTPDGTGTLIPRLSVHGNNRNENLDLCVMCHNPNQTDVPYRVVTADPRTSGSETSIDFKRMIHSIHAGEFRKSPYVVIGFNTSVNDFSSVRFPRSLRNCLNCHVVDKTGRGSYELPLSSSVLGTTTTTGSVYAVLPGAERTIDVDPFNDLRITPTAATCSGCHDSAEVRSHMTRTGRASFAAHQGDIGVTVKERCADCHGRGKKEDVRRVHEVGGSH
jgi:OmcA/MtrC family decaheme c-type cytochrome